MNVIGRAKLENFGKEAHHVFLICCVGKPKEILSVEPVQTDAGRKLRIPSSSRRIGVGLRERYQSSAFARRSFCRLCARVTISDGASGVNELTILNPKALFRTAWSGTFVGRGLNFYLPGGYGWPCLSNPLPRPKDSIGCVMCRRSESN